MAVMSDKEQKAQQAKQLSTPAQPSSLPKKPALGNLTQKQIMGIAMLVIGVILIGIAILTW